MKKKKRPYHKKHYDPNYCYICDTLLVEFGTVCEAWACPKCPNFSFEETIKQWKEQKGTPMNIYEAYLAVKEGKIIKASLYDRKYFILETTEQPVNKKRIIKIKPCDFQDADWKRKSLEGLEFSELEEVCIDSFYDTTIFEIITMEDLIKFGNAEWIRENSEID